VLLLKTQKLFALHSLLRTRVLTLPLSFLSGDGTLVRSLSTSMRGLLTLCLASPARIYALLFFMNFAEYADRTHQHLCSAHSPTPQPFAGRIEIYAAGLYATNRAGKMSAHRESSWSS
jgi:hypothetical protein